MASKLRLRKKKYHPQFEAKNDENKTRQTGIDVTTNTSIEIKDKRIFQRAIASAQKHNIKLEHGRENNADGNCSFESVIFNINDRSCFTEKLPMSPDFYRRVWTTDIMNKILDGTNSWNPGLTRSQIVSGFQELMETGVYERGFFGDMMMASIACGVRKRLLIFNTNEGITTTGHDPISVVDPTHYGGSLDNEIPVVVAYNLVHFESLHTVDRDDIDETIKLTKSYIAKPSRYLEEYGFTRNDISYLISNNVIKHPPEEVTAKNVEVPTPSAKLPKTSINQRNVPPSDKKINIEVNKSFNFANISFKELDNGKISCGICQTECIRLMSHLNGSIECSQYLNLEKLKFEFTKTEARSIAESKRL